MIFFSVNNKRVIHIKVPQTFNCCGMTLKKMRQVNLELINEVPDWQRENKLAKKFLPI
jgi:hypothetical protein